MLKLQPNIILPAVKFGSAVLLFVSTCCSAFALGGDNKTVLIESETNGQVAHLFLTARNTLEATVHLYFSKLENAQTSLPMPYDFVVNQPYAHRDLLLIKAKSEGHWHFDFKYQFKTGIASALRTYDYVYTLPYSASEHYACTQAPYGKFSHGPGSQSENAVDFSMPEGTRVLASRPGKVVAFRDDSKVGGPTKDFMDKDNFVTIKHDDGTYATYVHLKPKGVLVKLGQAVTVGTAIGLSGSTGWATEPHLHFEVYRVVSGNSVLSVPVRVNTPKGIVKTFKEGEIY